MDWYDPSNWLLVVMAAAAVLLLVLGTYTYGHKFWGWFETRHQHTLATPAQEGWTPTGVIDAVCPEGLNPEVPGNYVFQVEDRRTHKSRAGVDMLQIRRRNATLNEVKDIVSVYNAAKAKT